MAVHPLRPATDRRFGGPLPRQLPNQTRVHLTPPEFLPLHHAVLWSYAVLAVISNCYPPVWGRLPTRYSPVRRSVTKPFNPKKSKQSASLDLHVLGTPPAFILSQDQTLVKKFSLGPGKTTRFSYPVTYCFWVGIFRCLSLNYSSQKNLQGRCLLFSYQSSLCFRCFRQPYYIITSLSVCQQLFYFFLLSVFAALFPQRSLATAVLEYHAVN